MTPLLYPGVEVFGASVERSGADWRKCGCASRKGWCVQQELDLPGYESEAP